MNFIKLLSLAAYFTLVVGDVKVWRPIKNIRCELNKISCQLHDYMADDDIFRVFHTRRHSLPEYEIASITYGNFEQNERKTRIKRSLNDNKVSFRAFGKEVELFLEPNHHVLYGNVTPLYIASFNGRKFKYERKPFVS